MFLFRRVVDLYWRFFLSPEAYARHIGVTIGEICLIATRLWPSEPYLVKIGNNVQITSNVVIHTHGGGNLARIICTIDEYIARNMRYNTHSKHMSYDKKSHCYYHCQKINLFGSNLSLY